MQSNLKNIEIDFDVHKAIETERKSFSETPNQVLRRLLKIDSAKPQSVVKANYQSELSMGKNWVGKGITLPHGSLLRAEYNGRLHEGKIVDGRWYVEGNFYTSPSGALGSVARTKNGKKTSLDGWIYWEVKRPGDKDWIKINSLRR